MGGGRRVSIKIFELNSSDWRQLIGTWPTGRHIGFPGQLTGIPAMWISLLWPTQPPYWTSCMVRWLAFFHSEFTCAYDLQLTYWDSWSGESIFAILDFLNKWLASRQIGFRPSRVVLDRIQYSTLDTVVIWLVLVSTILDSILGDCRVTVAMSSR